MNIKMTTLAMALSSALFFTLPMQHAFAHEDHCEIKDTELGDIMKYMKSELKGYVKGFKGDNSEKMQKHLNELLILSEKAQQYIPVMITQMADADMDHSKMDMKDMDHSKMDMKDMDHSKMDMKDMDHSKMDMKDMDHSKMDMKDMDHSKMDHGDMNMDSADHDMSKMPSMEGMSVEQHHQHMKYMQGMDDLNDLFKSLNTAKDKAEIKSILGKIKEHSKKSHQQFRQDCS